MPIKRRCRRKTSTNSTCVFAPPYHWKGMLAFLAARATPGVEIVEQGSYRRSIAAQWNCGYFEISPEIDSNVADCAHSVCRSAMALRHRRTHTSDVRSQCRLAGYRANAETAIRHWRSTSRPHPVCGFRVRGTDSNLQPEQFSASRLRCKALPPCRTDREFVRATILNRGWDSRICSRRRRFWLMPT